MNEPTFPSFPDQSDWTDDQLNAFNEEFKKSNSIVLKAQRRAIEDKLTSYYKKMIDEEHYETFHPCNIIALKQLHKTKKIADEIIDVKQGKNPYCFFTVNLKPEMGTEEHIEQFDAEMQNFTEKCKYLQNTNYVYSIEQRSEGSETVHGVHAHIFFEKKDNSPSKLQRAFQNKFYDKWIGSPAALDYRYVGENKKIEKIKYILGHKEQSKMEKVYKDRAIKISHSLKIFHAKGFASDIEEIKSH